MGAPTASVDAGWRSGIRKRDQTAHRQPIAAVPSDSLLALTAEGDETAFAELYDRFGRPAFALAYRVLRDHELAEDAVQEGFLGVWRSAGSFRPGAGSARAFLLTFVHRRAVDRVRQEERRRGSREKWTRWRGEDDDEFAGSFERERVQAALALLPHRCREAIELAYYDGFTQQEIALHLRIPLGTVKSRTAYGLQALAELLREGETARESGPAHLRLAGHAER